MPPRITQTDQPATPATIEPAPPPKMELLVLANNLEFRWNVAEVKAAITAAVEKYRGLVVTEDNLPDMERTQKEIAGLRIKLDKFRVDTKKLLAEPATKFDSEVKELTAIIEEAELPLKEQLTKYEENRVTKRTQELLTFAKAYAGEIGLRPEYFKYEVPAKLTNRTTADAIAKTSIKAAIDDLLAQQGADDAAKEEARRKEEEAQAMARQRDMVIDLLCKSHSSVMGLRTPVTAAEIKLLLTVETPMDKIPDIIVAECRKRQEVEQAAAAVTMPAPQMAETKEPRSVSYTHPENCGSHDCLPGSEIAFSGGPSPAITSTPKYGTNRVPPLPVPPPWAGPPASTPAAISSAYQPVLYDVTLRFPAISIVNANALKMWLSENIIKFEVISQEPVKGGTES